MKTKLFSVLAAILLLSVLLSACVAGQTPSANMSSPAASSGTAGPLLLRAEPEPERSKAAEPSAPAIGSAMIGLEEAKALVLAQLGIPEADFIEKDYALDSGKYELEFTVNGMEYDYDVDAYTGEILKAASEPDNDPLTAPLPPALTPDITMEDAKALAFSYLGITEAETTDRDYDFDDGRYELSFNVGSTEYDFAISTTGEILRVEKELDDDLYDDFYDDYDD